MPGKCGELARGGLYGLVGAIDEYLPDGAIAGFQTVLEVRRNHHGRFDLAGAQQIIDVLRRGNPMRELKHLRGGQFGNQFA